MLFRSPPAGRDRADERAEVGPVLEGRKDAPELVALGELGRTHDVEEAVAEDLLDGLAVVLAEGPDDPLADPPGQPGLRVKSATV